MKDVRIQNAIRVAAIAWAGALTTGSALAAGPGEDSPEILNELLPQLIGVFVVATVMESALAILFQWRLYREFFNGRAVKTLVVIAFGFAVVKQFDYDVFDRIVTLAGGTSSRGLLSEFLSALVLAGGSAAIFQLFKALGLRPPVDAPEDKPQPASDKAWASVRIIRNKAVGDIRIHIDAIAGPSDQERNKPAIAGIAGVERYLPERLKGVFFSDSLRLPAYGGRTLDVDKVYRIVATGYRKADNPADPDVAFEQEIYLGRFAGRAVVDFVCTI